MLSVAASAAKSKHGAKPLTECNWGAVPLLTPGARHGKSTSVRQNPVFPIHYHLYDLGHVRDDPRGNYRNAQGLWPDGPCAVGQHRDCPGYRSHPGELVRSATGNPARLPLARPRPGRAICPAIRTRLSRQSGPGGGALNPPLPCSGFIHAGARRVALSPGDGPVAVRLAAHAVTVSDRRASVSGAGAATTDA